MIGSAGKSIVLRKNKLKRLLALALIGQVLLTGCATERRISRNLTQLFAGSSILKQHHAGFALYDMAAGKMLFAHHADKYFIPASNTKLFTFYAGLKMISDSIPSLRYVERGDSLIFWATGDPSFLHSKLKGTKAAEFLRNSSKNLFFAPGRYTGEVYGTGWSWDDYNDDYQAEINELPLMDNLLQVEVDQYGLTARPAVLRDCIKPDSLSAQKNFRVTRDLKANLFQYPAVPFPAKFSQRIPYKVSLPLSLCLLSDTLNKRLGVVQLKMPADAKTIYNLKIDSVLKEMMLPSDNFIAEQLLLVYASQLGDTLNAKKTIAYMEEQYLNELPDKPRWVDGSGLSRYNLLTPRDIIKLLDLIYLTLNDPPRLFKMLPAGGKSGTLKNVYPKTDQPFIFAKTGSLSGVHNQSGYVLTKKGKTYIFSFMNNNFVVPTSKVRTEIARIMTYIHDKF